MCWKQVLGLFLFANFLSCHALAQRAQKPFREVDFLGFGVGGGHGTGDTYNGQFVITEGVYDLTDEHAGMFWEAGGNRISRNSGMSPFGSINFMAALPVGRHRPEALFATVGGTLGGGDQFGPLNFGAGVEGQFDTGHGWRVEVRDYTNTSKHNVTFRVMWLFRDITER